MLATLKYFCASKKVTQGFEYLGLEIAKLRIQDLKIVDSRIQNSWTQDATMGVGVISLAGD